MRGGKFSLAQPFRWQIHPRAPREGWPRNPARIRHCRQPPRCPGNPSNLRGGAQGSCRRRHAPPNPREKRRVSNHPKSNNRTRLDCDGVIYPQISSRGRDADRWNGGWGMGRGARWWNFRRTGR